MPPENWWIFPMIMIVVMIVFFFIFLSRGKFRAMCCSPVWQNKEDNETQTALGVLKNRYAKGEITKEEFEQMKKDILS